MRAVHLAHDMMYVGDNTYCGLEITKRREKEHRLTKYIAKATCGECIKRHAETLAAVQAYNEAKKKYEQMTRDIELQKCLHS